MKLKTFLLLVVFFTNATLFAQERIYNNEFSLSDVKLLDGPFKHAQELNTQILLKYNTDRFLSPYLKVANLPSKAENYGNWESDGLDGHVGGHYLSALAIHYAATGNVELKKRMEYMLSELKKCQTANTLLYPSWGNGYLGAVPNSDSLWPNIKQGQVAKIWDYWVPWYNVHKMFVGLRDAWLYAQNEEAKVMFLDFCDWAIDVTSKLSDKQMEDMLNSEHGGMNEVLADAYQITQDKKYLETAKRFSHKALLNPLSHSEDKLDNLHANTQVPKAVGFQRIGELSGEDDYHKAGSFFWETLVNNRSLAFGGNSRREFFPSVGSCTDFIKVVEGPESCNTYNMLKLSEGLFRETHEAKYVGFYERALYNHILSTQHPDHGGYVYFTPARPQHYRVYSAPNKAMWCCVGTGLENHGKYGQFIYTHSSDSLFVNLFIASELSWKEKELSIKQTTNFPYEEASTFEITTKSKKQFTLLLRYPSWVAEGALKVYVNNKKQEVNAKPESYIALNRKWSNGDLVRIELPMKMRLEPLINVPDYHAFMYGPILLAAKTDTNDIPFLVAGTGRWEHIAHGKMRPLNEAPIIIEPNIDSVPAKISLIDEASMKFNLSKLNMLNSDESELVLEPFFKVHDARYMMYWSVLTPDKYKHILDSLAIEETRMLELESRTLDFVQPGQQQPESDHFMELSNSKSGVYMDEFWREARNGGSFSYELKTNGETELNLLLRFWGTNWEYRTFDILVDGEKIATENIRKWNVFDFKEEVYSVPQSLLKGKESIRVKFQAPENGVAGAIYFVRLFKPKSN